MAGRSVKEHWEEMRQRYYYLLGWDDASGRPKPETLAAFGLEEVIPDLWPAA